MKKLMIAAAAALCATVSVQALESANVVGYMDKTPTNFKFIGPNFINCNGTEGMTLGDLKINCDEEDPEAETGWAANIDTINILNAAGNVATTLVYIPKWLADAYTDELGYEVVKGWYDTLAVGEDMHTNYNLEPINAGEGFQVNVSAGADATVQIDSAL